MIIESILYLPLVITTLNYAPNNSYEYGATIHSNMNIPSLVSEATTDNPIYCDIRMTMTCYLSYNSVNDYNISDFRFTIWSDLYYVGSTNYELEYTLIYESYHAWEITNSTNEYLDNTYFTIGFNEDTLRINEYNNNELYNYSDYTMDEDSKYVSRVEVRFSSDSFMRQISNYIENSTNYDNGYNAGRDIGYGEGYRVGRTDGFNEGASMDTAAVTIFNGILNIALVPVNFFLAMFNFEILGINISSLVSALLSVCMVIIVIRMITGKKNGD